MKIKNFIVDFLGRFFDDKTGEQIHIDYEEVTAQIAAKKIAITSAVNLIGNAISMSKFETYAKGQKTIAEESTKIGRASCRERV